MRSGAERSAGGSSRCESCGRNPDLRRAELAWGGFHAAEWASVVALSVVAFEADGAARVGFVLFARMVPSAFVAPFVAVVGDRYRRERILVVVHLVRAIACLGAALALLADANILVVYVLAILAAVPLAAHRPCHLALAPLLARTPRELAASNVAALTFESTAVLLGPAVAALLLAVSGPAAVFVACAALSFLSFVAIVGIHSLGRPGSDDRRAPGVIHELRAGVARARRQSARPPRRRRCSARRRSSAARSAFCSSSSRSTSSEWASRVWESSLPRSVSAASSARLPASRSSAVGASAARSGCRSPAGACRSWSSASGPRARSQSSAWRSPGLANSLLDVSGFTSMQENGSTRR